MSLYGALDNTKHFEEFGTPLPSPTGMISAATRKATALTNLGLTPNAAAINLLVAGVAAGYKVARSAAPVALDGSNPTPVATGLATVVAAFVCLAGTAAPGTGTSVLSCAISGTTVNVYAWKPTATADTALVASTGTETFHWIAIGT